MEKELFRARQDVEFVAIQDTIGGLDLTGIREVYYDNAGPEEAPLKRDYFLVDREKSVVYLVFQVDEESNFDKILLARIKDSFVSSDEPASEFQTGRRGRLLHSPKLLETNKVADPVPGKTRTGLRSGCFRQSGTRQHILTGNLSSANETSNTAP